MLKPLIQRQDDEMHFNDNKQNDLFFNVEQILDSQHFSKTVKYYIHWKDYDETDNTWEPISSLQNVIDIVCAFHTTKPHALSNPSI